MAFSRAGTMTVGGVLNYPDTFRLTINNITFIDSNTTQAYIQALPDNHFLSKKDINGADAISYLNNSRIDLNQDDSPTIIPILITCYQNGRPPRTYCLCTICIAGSSMAVTSMTNTGNFRKDDYGSSTPSFTKEIPIIRPNYSSTIYANPFGQPYTISNIGPGRLDYGGNVIAQYGSVDLIPTASNIAALATDVTLTVKKGTNGKSFVYDSEPENAAATYDLTISSKGQHTLTYNGEAGVDELSVEVQNDEEIDVGYNGSWTQAPTTITLTPDDKTVTLRSNMQLTVTSENENIMDTITVNNEPQIVPYTGTITGTQNIVLKPTAPEITINYTGTSDPVISNT